MSPGRRRLLSLIVVAVVVAVGVVAYVRSGDDGPARTSYSGQAEALDPDPDLAAMKSAADVRPCTPGPGGGQLPSVTVSCLGGGTAVDLSTLRGPMVISFWASWRGPCKTEMPALQAFDQSHGDQVPVLGVNFEDRYPASALEAMKAAGATYPSLADPTGVLHEQATFAKILHLPVLVFIDQQGRIVWEQPGGVDSADDVAALVRQHLGIDL